MKQPRKPSKTMPGKTAANCAASASTVIAFTMSLAPVLVSAVLASALIFSGGRLAFCSETAAASDSPTQLGVEAGSAVDAGSGAGIWGKYVECRLQGSLPVGEIRDLGLRGDGQEHAILAWRIDRGSWDSERLDGLTVALLVDAEGIFLTPSEGRTRCVVLLDKRANKNQERALLALTVELAPRYAKNLVKIRRLEIGGLLAQTAPTETAAGTLEDGSLAAVNLSTGDAAEPHPGEAASNTRNIKPWLQLGKTIRIQIDPASDLHKIDEHELCGTTECGGHKPLRTLTRHNVVERARVRSNFYGTQGKHRPLKRISDRRRSLVGRFQL